MKNYIKTVVFFVAAFVPLCRCGKNEESSSKLDTSTSIDIPFQIIQQDGISTNEEGLDLIDLSNVNLKVAGCLSGYTQTFTSSGSLKLYSNDQNCVVKVVSFTSAGESYQVLSGSSLDPTGNSFDPVATHITTFQSTTNSSHLLYAQVVSQLPSLISSGASVQITLFALDKGTNFATAVPNNVLRVSAPVSSVDTNQASQTVNFTIYRIAQPNSTPLVVNYSLAGNAVAGTDYTAPSGTITMGATDTSKNIAITLTSKIGIPDYTKTLQFNFENGNYFWYRTSDLITLTNSSSAAPPTTNLIFHYDNTSILSSAGNVTGWTDLGGSGRNAIQSIVSDQPTLTTASAPLSALNSILFNSTTQYLTVPNDVNINSGTSAYTAKVITVAFVTGTDVANTQFIFAQGNGTAGLSIGVKDTKIFATGWQETGTSWGPVYAQATASANTFYIFTLAFDATAGTIKAYANGILADTETGVGSFSPGGSNGIGGGTGGSYIKNKSVSDISASNCKSSEPCYFGGQILEMYYYNGTLTDSQIISQHNFLTRKLYNNTVSIQTTSNASVNELSGTLAKSLIVKLSSPRSSDLTVSYTVDSSSTAVLGTDYTALPGSVTIPAGYTSAYIPVTVLHNTGSTANKTLTLNLSTSSNYTISGTAGSATLNIIDVDNYTPPDLLVRYNVPQNLSSSSVNLVTNWNDVATGTTCTHPLAAYQNAANASPIFSASSESLLFDGTGMLNIDSNSCLDDISGGVAIESAVIVFQTGSDVTTDQVLYKQGNSTTGLNAVISNGNLIFTVYDSGWSKYLSSAVSANTFYAAILEFKNNASLKLNLSSRLGASSGVTWNSTTTAGTGAALSALSNNGIGIGGVRNGIKFYSSNTNAYVTVANTTSSVNLLQNGTRLYELFFMNLDVISQGSTTLTNLRNYLSEKYVR